jgi:hypothetical protein
MASTYVNDLRLNEMATGDQSGSWGTVTNTNLELIGEAFSYGTETIGDADSTLTIADGASDPVRSFFLKITSSADLTTTRIVTIAPNTVSKVWMIENATTGSQIITIKQGSGATINVPNGQVKMISTDGAGSGAAVTDLLVDVDLTGTTTLVNLNVSGAVDIAGDLTLSAGGDGALRFTAASSVKVLDNNAAALVFEEADNAYMTFVTTDGSEAVKFDKALDINAATQIDATVTVGVNDTGYDVKFFGATTGKSLLWDESADSLIVTGTTTLVGTTNLDAVDIDGATQIDATVTVGVNDTGYDVKFFGATAGAYMLWDESADDLILGGAAGLSVNSAALVTGVLTTTAATVSNGGGQFNGAINVGVNDTGYDVKFFGATAGAYMLWDESADDLILGGAAGLSVNSAALVTGVLTTTAATVSNGGGQFNGAINVGVDDTGYDVKFFGATTGKSLLWDESADSLTVAGNLSVDGGTIKLDGNYPVGTNNVALGDAALDSNVSGASNVAIGADALTANTASYNTAVGYQAIYSNTTGNALAALGYQALFNNTGSNNSAVGYQALTSNTSGSTNTAVGDRALTSNTTASYNTAVGYQAGYSNTTGAGGNAAFGAQSLYSTTTGDNNVAIAGYRAMYSNTTGSNNVAMGNYCLSANTTGGNNVSIGFSALGSNTTASNNTAVGHEAGYTNETGTRVTYFGNDAGKLSTVSDNTFIGQSSGSAMTTGDANTILGRYDGNQGSLDIRTSSNNIVLSDGDGNPRFYDRNGTTYSPSIYNIATSGGSTVSIGSDASMFRNTSSLRYKKNVVDTSRGLSDVMKLRAVQYESIAPQEAGKVFGGLIAEELHDSGLTEFVEYNLEGQPDAVHYANMVSLAFKAIQELKAEFDAYKATHP